MGRFEAELPAVTVSRESRQEPLWDAPGALTASRGFGAKIPVFEGGSVFEVWASLVSPSPVPLIVTFIHFPAARPTQPRLVYALTVPAGAYTHVSPQFDHRVYRGDQLSAGVEVAGSIPEGQFPGTELSMVARVG